MELAKSIATSSNIGKVKRNWLRIAKYIIDVALDTKGALKLLQESNGILQVEDLLSILPDFTEIDLLKNEICLSLEISGERIENLKSEMNELSDSADSISIVRGFKSLLQ